MLQVKLHGNPDAYTIVDITFTPTAIVIEDKSGNTQLLPSNLLTLADRTPNTHVFGLVVLSSDRKYFHCHLLSNHRVSLQGTMEFISDNLKKLLSARDSET